jgi:hypothetical protein
MAESVAADFRVKQARMSAYGADPGADLSAKKWPFAGVFESRMRLYRRREKARRGGPHSINTRSGVLLDRQLQVVVVRFLPDLTVVIL